jgi:hypothetical protein
MVSQTDFRKYDGMLRMALDLTLEQADALEAVLEQERDAGRLVYGFHRSDSALMTCLVFDLTSAAHVHFIDGADGGFALAARQLKEQIAGSRLLGQRYFDINACRRLRPSRVSLGTVIPA